MLAQSYHSALVNQIKEQDYRYESGRLTVHLAAKLRLLLRRRSGGGLRLSRHASDFRTSTST